MGDRMLIFFWFYFKALHLSKYMFKKHIEIHAIPANNKDALEQV